MRTKSTSILVLLLIAANSLLVISADDHLIVGAQTPAQGFQVISARWGNSTANVEAGPGDQDLPLYLTLQYLYPYTALYAQLNILLPSGFTTSSSPVTGQPENNATIYYSNSLQKGQVFQVETFVNLSDYVSLGKYNFPTTITWNAVLSNSTVEPEVSLEQAASIAIAVQGDTKLSYTTSQTALTPGQVNNLTLTLDNVGSGNASNIETIVSSGSSQQVSVLNQFPQITTLQSRKSTSANIDLFVSSSAAGSSVSLSITSTYLDGYGNQQSKTQTVGLFVSTASSSSQLVVKSIENSLTPGQINNITLTVTNEGSQTLRSISTQVSSSSAQSVSVLSQPDVIQSLSPGNSTSLEIGLFVSATSSNTAVTLSIASTFTVVGSNETGTASQNLGLYVSSQAASFGNSSLSVSTIENQLLTGVPSQVEFNVTNTGTSAIYDPSFALSATSPLVVMSNSTYAMNGGDLAAGKSILFWSSISSSPSAAVGVYDGTLTVSYSNQYGISDAQTTQVGFVLTGTIDLVIQDEAVTLSSGNLTVSGSLLNEGTASAYYASVVGSANSTRSSGPTTYIGQIDPNTPVPFSTTIPFTLRAASEKVDVNLQLSYKNSFGSNLLSDFNTTTTVAASLGSSASTTPTTSSSDVGVVQAALYGIIVVVVIAAVIGVVTVRRKRRLMRVESGEQVDETKVV